MIHSTLLVFVRRASVLHISFVLCHPCTGSMRPQCDAAHVKRHIAMVMLNTCCFVWFFFSFFQAIASTHEIWNGNTLHQDLVCQCFVQVGGRATSCPRLSNCVLEYRSGIALVSFFPVTFQKNCLHIGIITATYASRGNEKQKHIDIKYNKYIYTYCILHVTSIHETIHDNLQHGSHVYIYTI